MKNLINNIKIWTKQFWYFLVRMYYINYGSIAYFKMKLSDSYKVNLGDTFTFSKGNCCRYIGQEYFIPVKDKPKKKI